MKNLLILALTFSLMFRSHAQTHEIRGDSVMDVLGGSYAGIKPALYPIIGSTNALVPFGFPIVTWTPLSAAAIRWSLSSPPTATTNGGYCQIQIIAPQGTLITNVADAIQWDGAWGILNAVSGTNYIDLSWDGHVLTGRQTPNYGVSTPAQITSNQDNYVIDTSANEIRIFSDAARNITGIIGTWDHNLRLLRNRGSFTITLKDSVTSTTTNQWKLNADLPLLAHQTVIIYYDTVISRWCVIGGGSSSSSGASIDVQTFTPGTNVWTKPAGAKTVHVVAIASGASGGSGRRGPSATAQGGGAGGSGGGHTFMDYLATDLPATVAVAVGGGPVGGAAVTVDSTSGNPGLNGTNSTFHTNCVAGGGGLGNGGTSAVGGTASNGNRVNGVFAGNAAGAGSAGAATGTAGTGGNTAIGIASGGGGGGGGVDADGTTNRAGGAGGHLSSSIAGAGSGGGSGGGTPGGTGGNGQPSGTSLPGAGGGGGGARATGGVAGTGGNGGLYGGGGGGGGAALNGNNSGAGGSGADGILVVITYF